MLTGRRAPCCISLVMAANIRCLSIASERGGICRRKKLFGSLIREGDGVTLQDVNHDSVELCRVRLSQVLEATRPPVSAVINVTCQIMRVKPKELLDIEVPGFQVEVPLGSQGAELTSTHM